MTTALSTSLNLIQRASRRDQSAWVQMTQLYGPLVYSWGRQHGLQQTDAADLVQDVFRCLYQSIDRFDAGRPGVSFRSWLIGIAHNRLRDFFRQRQQQLVGQGGSTANAQMQEVCDPLVDADSVSTTRGLALRALALIETEFEESTWRAFYRTAVEGISPKAVSEELGISVAAVYKAKSRVLQRLRAELGTP